MLMTTNIQSIPIPQTRKALVGYPEGGLRFDWAMIALSALFAGGLWIDGWAHFHGRTDNTFFTPWHFLFYGAFGLVGLFLAFNAYRNVGKGYVFRRALPVGYWLSLLGAVTFAVGGVGDMIWHTLFGIEAGTEALTSPTHLILAIGMFLVWSGPLRAAWLRTGTDERRGWGALGPAIISVALLFSLLGFFTSYAHPLIDPLVRFGRSRQDFGVTTILLQAALLMGTVLFVMRRWRLPFGALTVIFTLNALLMVVLTDLFILVPGALIAGLIADVLRLRIQATPTNPLAFRIFAFATPVIYYALYFVTVQLVIGVQWHVHVWAGAMFLAGVIGLMLSYLLVQPQVVTETPIGGAAA